MLCGILCLVCGVLWYVVSLCVVCCGMLCLVCGVCHAEKPMCPLNTSPCVCSKRPRVYRHHAQTCFNMSARGAGTHGDVLSGHTGRVGGEEREGSSSASFFSSVKQVFFDIS